MCIGCQFELCSRDRCCYCYCYGYGYGYGYHDNDSTNIAAGFIDVIHTQQCQIELRSECNKRVINGDQNTQSSNKFGGQPHMLAGDGQGNVKRRFHSCVAEW